MATITEIKEEIKNIKAELNAAMDEYNEADAALEAYEMDSTAWRTPEYQGIRNALADAKAVAAAKTRKIGEKLDAAKKELYHNPEYICPMRDLIAAYNK